ncbi:MAG: hypothetical protein HN978_20820 [Desulfobacula sp.]|nr:hypothetical protein [Desulfobacula sp.]
MRTCRHYFKNLVIAATGKGKTVIASFDYQRCRRDNEEFQDHLSHGWGKGANKIKWYL